jgi:hypothetical protein
MRVKICPRCREANDDIAHVCMHCHESLIHVQSVEEGRADREAAPSLPTAGGADGAAPESGYAAGERTAGGELYIECVSGADFVKRIGDGDVLGRGADVDVRCIDPANLISRRHAVFTRRGGTWWIEHLSENNPTKLNFIPLERGRRYAVSDGDRLTVSDKDFILRIA